MNNVIAALKLHKEQYPKMKPCDAVKLIYQNEFGCGHMIKDEESSLNYLIREYDSIEFSEKESMFEDIGNGYSRLNLRGFDKSKLPLLLVNKMFVETSKRTGTIDSFEEKLSILKELTQLGYFNFEIDELSKYLEEYKMDGYKAVSHSEEYRKEYHPAYRVIDSKYIRILPLIIKINELLQGKSRIILGIDGNAASGKTTIARLLSGIFDSNVIHMDDFFLPSHLRSKERFEEVAGNIHYERFLSEVVAGLRSKEKFQYQIFSCKAMDYVRREEVTPKPLTIIEGAYSMHPKYASIYDYKVFSYATFETQKERILARDGMEYLDNFINKWIPLENKYFSTCSIKELCDMIVV